MILYVFSSHLTNCNVQTNILTGVKRIQFLMKGHLNLLNQLKQKSIMTLESSISPKLITTVLPSGLERQKYHRANVIEFILF